MNVRIVGCVLIAIGGGLAATLPGCGSGSGSGSATGSGALVLAVTWPRNQLQAIPVCADTVQVTVRKGDRDGAVLCRQIAHPPVDVEFRRTSIVCKDLPAGPVWVEATAHATQDASDTAAARAEATATILAGRRVTVSLVTSSTVRLVKLVPPPMNPDQTQTLVASAYADTEGQNLINCANWSWSSSDETTVKVVPSTGEARALRCGQATITATERNSGQTAMAVLMVQPRADQLLKVGQVRILPTGSPVMNFGPGQSLPTQIDVVTQAAAVQITIELDFDRAAGVSAPIKVAPAIDANAFTVTRLDTSTVIQPMEDPTSSVSDNSVSWKGSLPSESPLVPVSFVDYLVTLKGDPPAAVTSQQGCRLDGNFPPGSRQLPSGNDTEGGDLTFVVHVERTIIIP
jgi:hypothetical protein